MLDGAIFVHAALALGLRTSPYAQFSGMATD